LPRYNVEALIDLLPSLGEALRRRGLKVGTGQLVTAARILHSYSVLVNRSYIDEDEVSLVLASTLALKPQQLQLLLNEVKGLMVSAKLDANARRIRDEIDENLRKLGLKPGDRVVKKRVLSGPRRRERVAAYLLLRKAGVIRGPRGRERVVGEAEISLISKRIASMGYESIGEALEEAPTWSEDDSMLRAEAKLDVKGDLGSLESRRLLSLGKAAMRKGDSRLLKAVAEELGKRILRGERIDGEEVIPILRRAGSLSIAHERILIASDPALVRDLPVGGREIAEIASGLGWERGGELVAKALRIMDAGEARRLIEGLDPSLLWAVRRHPFKGVEGALLDAATKAARGLYEALKFAETGEPGRADMAKDLALRAIEDARRIDAAYSLGPLSSSSIESLASTALAIVEALETGGGNAEHLASTLRRLGPTRSLQVLRGLYARVGGEERELIVRATASLLYRFAAREGLRLLPRNETSLSPPGRLEVRRTIYRLGRLATDPLVFRRRLKSRRISLALDVSGSMLDHSMWALTIAVLFSSNIERLTLFSSEPRILEGPFTATELARTLLSVRFAGYTDIASALRAAAGRGTKRIVLVSDLKQTIEPGDPVDVASQLVRRGYKLLAIVPPGHDSATRTRMEEVGALVRVAYTPREAAREVLRSLLR